MAERDAMLDDSGIAGGRRSGAAITTAVAVVLGAAAIVQARAYWPGLMTWDAIRQYDQATSGDFDDWHPPAMEYLWRQLGAFGSGPAPMLVLQLLLYWSGFALLIGRASASRRHGLAVGLAAAALLPISLALFGAVLKDCLMAGALLTATGLLAWRLPGEGSAARARSPSRRGDAVLRFGVVLLCLFAATLRFNALFASLPLVMAVLPGALARTPSRRVLGGLVATVLLFAAMPLANRAIGAAPSGVELSLVMFDLGGITEGSGVDMFPPLPAGKPVADPVAVNRRCYSPVKWDPYSWWVAEPCPIGFEAMRRLLAARHSGPYRLWLGAIAAHPLAYAVHRLRHFNINARFIVADEVERPVQVATIPNIWGYHETPGPALAAIDAAAVGSASTPFGWPAWWMAVALAALILAPGLDCAPLAVPLALSALLYGLDYLVFSVAAELRYHLWTMIAASIAAVLVTADLIRDGASRTTVLRSAVAASIPILVGLLCALARAGLITVR